jgi:acetyltransferase-like isoleucine patch superfamily enzyme
MLAKIILRIKRRDNRFYSFLYEVGKKMRSMNIPVVRCIHLPLYYVDYTIKNGVGFLIQTFWSIPLFKARCEKVGKNLRLPNGIPLVIGSHLRIVLGDDVRILRATIGASKVFDAPLLQIGNNSGVGYGTTISVSKEVIIGDDCMIGPNCMIMDSDDHPVSPEKRLKREAVSVEHVQPVRIGNNVWIGANCAILKGVIIGDNSVIAAHSVVTKAVLPNSVYAGYPARPMVRNIDTM